MTRRTALSLGGLAVASALSLVAVTNAWFISVDATPEGEGVTSALVRYLPEEAQRTSESLVEYGNLLSGGSIDPDGIPLILPGDSLLSSTYQAASANGLVQVTRTSIARAYEAGDSAGTVIHAETRYRADGTFMRRTQRDRMEGPKTEQGWYDTDGTAIQPPAGLTGYTSLTTSSKDVTTSDDKSRTTTVSSYVTTYTPPVGSGKPAYEYRQTITTVVYHEEAGYTGGAETDWPADAVRTVTTEETVLAPAWSETAPAPAPTVTRSALVITDSAVGGGGTEDSPAPIPLSVENRSTVPTRLRLGLSVVLDSGKAGTDPVPLEVQEQNGTWYFGQSVLDVGFIDLFAITPYSGQGGYGWTKNAAESDGLWTLWDLNVGAAGSDDFVVPPPEAPALDETGAAAEPEAKRYTAIQAFSVSGESHFGLAEAVFQEQFNELYCAGNPVIQVRLRYYVRQDEYMEWSQFYTQNASLTFGGITTADSGGGS